MPNDIGYNAKEALPNKLMGEDGAITDFLGNEVENASPAYNSKPSLPNKFLNPDGSYSTLTELLPMLPIYTDVRKVKDYLYEICYDRLDYNYAYEYFETQRDADIPFACSAVRKGNLYGRNFDWTYDESAEFVVKTSRINGRYASIGIASAIPGLTEEVASSGKYNEGYKILPFRLVDGINEYGVTVNVNVVPLDKGATTGTTPTGTVEVELCVSMLTRYILDHFKTATEAVTYLQAHASIYASKTLTDMHYNSHFMVADTQKTYLLEFVENELVVTDMAEGSNSMLAGKSYMTNFYLNDVLLNNDDTVYTPETQDDEHDAKRTNNITDNGVGLERYNIIANAFDSITNKSDMKTLLTNLKYTRTYLGDTEPCWYTEFTGDNNLTVTSIPEEFAETIQEAQRVFAQRTRTPGPYFGTWQTTHSVIYDIENKTMSVVTQEDGIENEFEFDYYYTAKEIDELAEVLSNPEIFIVVETLPTVGEHNKIYLVPNGKGEFEEWFYTSSNKWDKIGNIDLTGLATKDEVAESLATAKSYADSKKAEAIASSNSYADTKKTEAIVISEGYADSVAASEGASALAAAKIYTDDKIKEKIEDALGGEY